MIYKITQTMQATQYWTYEVEASSQEEALNKVSDGDVEPIDYGIDDSNSDSDNVWEAVDIEIVDTYEKSAYNKTPNDLGPTYDGIVLDRDGSIC
jgi:hypothetical protein